MSLPRPLRVVFVGLSLLAVACGSDPVGPPATPPGTHSLALTPVSGGDQVGRATRPLATPLQVRAERDGLPVTGVQVIWHTIDGELEPSGPTDADGIATAVWTLPPYAGIVRASARLEVGGPSSVIFRGEARLPELRKVGGDIQTATVGETLPEPLQVQVMWEGEPLAGEAVQWSFLSAPVISGADGIASATWTLAVDAGGHRATARISRLTHPVAHFSATAVPGPLTELAFHPPSDNFIRYWTRGSQVRYYVTARDMYGNTLGGIPLTWSVATGDGTFQGTATDPSGTAYVDMVAADDYAGDITMRAAAQGVESMSDPSRFTHFMFEDPTGWGDIAFPSRVTVAPGTPVRWVHHGLYEHAIGPKGEVARATLREYGSVVELSFTTAGIHEWICVEHDWETFTIVVDP